MSKRKKPQITADYIEWSDHVSLDETGWKSKKDATDLSPTVCKSVGFVVKENSKELVLVSSIADDHVDGEVCIIKSCITRRERIWPK